jgi:hypothetical protein
MNKCGASCRSSQLNRAHLNVKRRACRDQKFVIPVFCTAEIFIIFVETTIHHYGKTIIHQGQKCKSDSREMLGDESEKAWH